MLVQEKKMDKCIRFNKCYFPRDERLKHYGVQDVQKYIDSCRNLGIGCKIADLSDLEFKTFERSMGEKE